MNLASKPATRADGTADMTTEPHLTTPAPPTTSAPSAATSVSSAVSDSLVSAEVAARRAKRVVFMVVFLDLLGFGIVLPLLPRYADSFLTELRVPEWAMGVVVGLLYSLFSVMQLIFAPIWGRISDRIGRRPIILLGLVGSVIFYALFALASQLDPATQSLTAVALLFVARIGAGIAGATVATAQAVIADTTTPEERSRGMAIVGAAFGIGFTFGPLIAFAALIFADDARAAPGLAASVLSGLALVVAWRQLPETCRAKLDSVPINPSAATGRLNFRAMGRTLRAPTVGLLVLVFFLAVFGFATFEGTLSLFTERAFGFDNRSNFLVFAYIGFVLLIAQGLIYRRLARSLGEVLFIRLGSAGMLTGLAMLCLVGLLALADSTGQSDETMWWVRLGLFLLALAVAVTGFAFLNPSVQGLISKRSDPARQGEVFGVNQSFGALARILGPFCGLALFFAVPGYWVPYALGAALLCVVLALTPRIDYRQVR